MQLTSEQAGAFRDHLASVGATDRCPFCHESIDLPAVAELVAVPTYMEFRQGTTPLRQIRCVCPHCSIVHCFDAKQLGIGTAEIAERVSAATRILRG